MRRMIVRVLPDQALDRPLDYIAPPEMAPHVGIGSRVRVPVKSRMVLATVLDLPESSPFPRLREVAELLSENPMISPVLLRMARWVADYYCCGQDTALRCVLPRVIRSAEVGHRMAHAVIPARLIGSDEIGELEKRAPKQAEILRLVLKNQGAVLTKDLSEQIGNGAQSVVRTLIRKGWLSAVEVRIERDPHAAETYLPSPPHPLNPGQQAALSNILVAVRDPAGH